MNLKILLIFFFSFFFLLTIHFNTVLQSENSQILFSRLANVKSGYGNGFASLLITIIVSNLTSRCIACKCIFKYSI